MANPEQVALLKRGAKAWNEEWERLTPVPILGGADLRGADLRGVSFFQADLDNLGANLDGVDLRGALLENADFSRAYLRGAQLAGADLSLAKLSGAYLDGADLNNTKLWGTHFEPAPTMLFGQSRAVSVSGTIFDKAQLYGTVFRDMLLDQATFAGSVMDGVWFVGVNLAGAKSLNRVIHKGPSVIDIRTIYASHGSIPEIFLRGCGVPDALITFQRSFVGQVIQFYSCFISYSTNDQVFADQLHSDLQNNGVRCWFAPHDVKSGKKLHEQIDEAIRSYDRLLLILSEPSMNSEWVKTEIAHARQKELTEKRQVLFPISLVPFEKIRQWKCFDTDAGKDSAREIREYFIPDFSNWQDHDSYRQAFQGLVRDLKAEEKQPDRADEG